MQLHSSIDQFYSTINGAIKPKNIIPPKMDSTTPLAAAALDRPIEREYDEKKYWQAPKTYESRIGVVTVPDKEKEEPETVDLSTCTSVCSLLPELSMTIFFMKS